MSKNKHTDKVLIRNAALPTRPSKPVEKSQSLKKVHFSDDVLPEASQTFSVPEFCTVLQLADEMKAIRNSRCAARSLPEVSKYRNLNFLPEEKIYQDLVEVDVPEGEFVSEVRSEPCVKLKKDPDLDFSKYLKYDLEPEYFFTSCAVPLVSKQTSGFNGHSIYNKLVTWRLDED